MGVLPARTTPVRAGQVSLTSLLRGDPEVRERPTREMHRRRPRCAWARLHRPPRSSARSKPPRHAQSGLAPLDTQSPAHRCAEPGPDTPRPWYLDHAHPRYAPPRDTPLVRPKHTPSYIPAPTCSAPEHAQPLQRPSLYTLPPPGSAHASHAPSFTYSLYTPLASPDHAPRSPRPGHAPPPNTLPLIYSQPSPLLLATPPERTPFRRRARAIRATFGPKFRTPCQGPGLGHRLCACGLDPGLRRE